MSIKLIVGLGNPGAEYAETRHNAGAWLVEFLAQQENVSLRYETKFTGSTGIFQLSDCDCRLLIPDTFMNLSGKAVRAIAEFYKFAPSEILVVHDELDLPVGTVRLKHGGGHGGHNGLRDIIAQLHSHDFYRMRLGIAHPGERHLVLDYVLHRPSRDDKQLIDDAIANAINVIPELLKGQMDKAMQKLHTQATT
jgi:PTH1 family peptidyl-tRNA hydrolase